MRPFSTIQKNPVPVLCAVVAGVVGWALSAAVNAPPAEPELVVPPGGPPAVVQAQVMVLDVPPSEYRLVSGEVLPKLKPGMTRVEIEDLLGPPTSNSLQPVVAADGRLTYHTAYELADPDPLMTVRPIRAGGRRLPTPPVADPGPPAPPALLALEFDASKPGHPLIGVVYLDPLF